MNVLIIGGGAREHALAYYLAKSPSTLKVYAAPGNPGIFEVAHKADIDPSEFNRIAAFCYDNSIDLVVVGPEQPLSQGLADYLEGRSINVFGPTKKAAQLESSKSYAKDFMVKYEIPTAKYNVFSSKDYELAENYVDKMKMPVVIKADGLAAGKGVVIAENHEEAHNTLREMFEGKFGQASKKVVVEEFLKGEEASVLAICDGADFVLLAPAQDHKRQYDNDKGKNTGGMGAYAPAPLVNDAMLDKVGEMIIKPALEGMQKEGHPFKGCLYAGLMINGDEINVVEFNVRFGDPETQSVLSVFDGDLAMLLYSAATGDLKKGEMKSRAKGYSCNVVIAAEGYPDDYPKGMEISGLLEAEDLGLFVFHAGTRVKDDKLISSGGRVLSVTSLEDDLKSAIDYAYEGVSRIKMDNMHYRKDIGQKALKDL